MESSARWGAQTCKPYDTKTRLKGKGWPMVVWQKGKGKGSKTGGKGGGGPGGVGPDGPPEGPGGGGGPGGSAPGGPAPGGGMVVA